MAACSVMRSLVGGLAPLFSHKIYQKLDVGWSFSLLAFIALAFAPVPWVFYTFGKKWRAGERYGGRDDTGGLEREQVGSRVMMVEVDGKALA